MYLLRPSLYVTLSLAPLLGAFVASGQNGNAGLEARFAEMSRRSEERGLAEPFKGITTDGTPVEGLFPVRSTGVSMAPVREATAAFLKSLSEDQRRRTMFAVDDDEWRKWMNQHFYIRQGVGFGEMSEDQREAAFALLRASLSAEGLELTRDIMRLNHTLGELNNDNFVEYGEWLYWITVMGEPSSTEPWGWQIDGHHVIINYFVLGDQVVMTPLFIGSEPVTADSGKYAGTTIMQAEQDDALAFVNTFNAAQKSAAILKNKKDGNNNLTEAFRDNVVLNYQGLRGDALSSEQRGRLLNLIELYVGNLRDDQAKVRMEEVAAHLDNTWFAWIGETSPDGVFYYRIQSPVILIEFDHQRVIGLRHMIEGDAPSRQHIHAVVRTPNGNDYGKDLLRQHYEASPHAN